jgi:hypothetical protein
MVFSEGDKAIIEVCFTEKDWGGGRIVLEFPGKFFKNVMYARY